MRKATARAGVVAYPVIRMNNEAVVQPRKRNKMIGFSEDLCGWRVTPVKDDAYFSYCTYLCILRYSGFLWLVPANTGIFLRGLKLCEESKTWQVLLYPKRKFGVTMHFSEI